MHVTRYLREVYDQQRVALSLKTQMVKAKAIEALLNECTCYNRALKIAGCESIETNLAHDKTLVGGDAHSNERRAVAQANGVRKP